jgi:CO/xanthine dehydrogenase Mo-binding subunit
MVSRSPIGQSVPRREGFAKVTGAAQYTDDLVIAGAWYGKTVRTTIPAGRVRSITLDPGGTGGAFDWSRVVVVTADDIPGENVVHLIRDDQPVLARVDGEIRHKEEPILLLAAPDRATLEAAAQHVRIEYEQGTPVYDLDGALGVYSTIEIKKGVVEGVEDVEGVEVVEGSFRVGLQEQLYIEPQGAIAIPEPGGAIRIIGSLQCPYYVHRALKRALKLTDAQAIVVQAETGGGFGGKEEYPSIVAIHAALLARKAGRPVRLIYDRHEDLAATTKRHPGVITHRTTVKKDGTLLAQDIEIVLDGGGYCTLTPVVLSRAAIHGAGAYSCPNVRIRARAVATNTPPNGAFRGFGAPQSLFAAELMVEHVAERLGMSSVDLRRKWMLRLGDTTATGQVLTESVGSELVLDAALRNVGAVRPSGRPAVKRGRGLSLVFHGSGFTGSGEKKLQGTIAMEALADGTFQILTASTEIGQGTKTIFCQLAADALGVSLERVTLAPQDTSLVPDSGPTVASRTAMIVGRLVQDAATEIKERLARGEKPPIRVQQSYIQPDSLSWDETNYRGDAYPIYAWACTIADVDVDMATGEVRVTDLVTAVDCGRALHPVMAEGQIEGGSLQAVGWATIEEIKMKDGGYQNDRLATYLIPTALDAPRIRTILVENPYSRGPFGAKGIGELPMDGPAPAIIAAIHDATGVWLDEIPATPEKVLAACALR